MDCPVVTMSKILKMKAIHNDEARRKEIEKPVVTMSKILKMKAIHNDRSSIKSKA